MTNILVEILNEHGPDTRSSVNRQLAAWDGFGSLSIAETLRALLQPFEPRRISIRIWRDVYRPFPSVEYPEAQYMIWDTRVTYDGKPVLTGYVMIHKGFPERDSRCTFRYTPTGARLRQQLVRNKTTASR